MVNDSEPSGFFPGLPGKMATPLQFTLHLGLLSCGSCCPIPHLPSGPEGAPDIQKLETLQPNPPQGRQDKGSTPVPSPPAQPGVFESTYLLWGSLEHKVLRSSEIKEIHSKEQTGDNKVKCSLSSFQGCWQESNSVLTTFSWRPLETVLSLPSILALTTRPQTEYVAQERGQAYWSLVGRLGKGPEAGLSLSGSAA